MAILTNTPFLACTVIAFFGVLIYVLAYVMLKKNTIKLTEILTFYAVFVYIVGCFSSMVIIRYSDSNLGIGNGEIEGKYVYLLAFLGAWVCDTLAYFVGKFLGKHKLIPEISPKKTIEGSIGGIIACVLSVIVYVHILKLIKVDNIIYSVISIHFNSRYISLIIIA